MERSIIIKEEKREKTNFSLTCSLLRQYMKEKKSFGGIGFEMDLEQKARGVFRPPITMNLMAGIDLNAPDSGEVHFPEVTSDTAVPHKDQNINKDGANAQLTIFYGGEVLVFDNFSGEKAEELIEMAKKSSVSTGNYGFATATSSAFSATSGGGHVVTSQCSLQGTMQANASDLPIARRKSLHRFLQKRKDRINSKSPYQMNEMNEVKLEDSSNTSWLTFKL